jgi:hypothetical protein
MFFVDNSGRMAELAVNPMTNTARTGARTSTAVSSAMGKSSQTA